VNALESADEPWRNWPRFRYIVTCSSGVPQRAPRLRAHCGLLGRPGEVALAHVASEAARQLRAEQGPRSHNATIMRRGSWAVPAIAQRITARYVWRPGLPRLQLRANALRSHTARSPWPSSRAISARSCSRNAASPYIPRSPSSRGPLPRPPAQSTAFRRATARRASARYLSSFSRFSIVSYAKGGGSSSSAR
jgi:hypothetical protein